MESTEKSYKSYDSIITDIVSFLSLNSSLLHI